MIYLLITITLVALIWAFLLIHHLWTRVKLLEIKVALHDAEIDAFFDEGNGDDDPDDGEPFPDLPEMKVIPIRRAA